MQTNVCCVAILIFALAVGNLFAEPVAISRCPYGVPVVNCLVDPCSVSSCPGDPTATCTSNYCGGCNAIWRKPNGQLAQCNQPTTCPYGVPVVNCLVDPCSVSSCPGDPTATCTSNYCGGCNAIWRRPNGALARCKRPTICPYGVPVVNCLVDPCRGKTCTAYPTAICVANYCGGCNFNWYKPNGEKVTCDSSS